MVSQRGAETPPAPRELPQALPCWTKVSGWTDWTCQKVCHGKKAAMVVIQWRREAFTATSPRILGEANNPRDDSTVNSARVDENGSKPWTCTSPGWLKSTTGPVSHSQECSSTMARARVATRHMGRVQRAFLVPRAMVWLQWPVMSESLGWHWGMHSSNEAPSWHASSYAYGYNEGPDKPCSKLLKTRHKKPSQLCSRPEGPWRRHGQGSTRWSSPASTTRPPFSGQVDPIHQGQHMTWLKGGKTHRTSECPEKQRWQTPEQCDRRKHPSCATQKRQP